MRPYLVWAPPYSHATGGVKVLHRFVHELNAAGQEASISTPETNPEWNTPHREPPLAGDWIAAYPEVVQGNPWGAERVARWVLNTPGLRGGDRSYAPSEMVFSYSPIYLDAMLLHLPAVELDIYADRHEPRSGTLVYTGKATRWRKVAGREITLEEREDRHALADALNRATALYCFDMTTAMIDIARLCGCPVVVIPDGSRSFEDYDRHVGWNGIGWNTMPLAFDPERFRSGYLDLFATFRRQLDEFVRITQA